MTATVKPKPFDVRPSHWMGKIPSLSPAIAALNISSPPLSGRRRLNSRNLEYGWSGCERPSVGTPASERIEGGLAFPRPRIIPQIIGREIKRVVSARQRESSLIGRNVDAPQIAELAGWCAVLL